MPYIDPLEIDRVKQIDLLTYLICNEPDEVIKRSAREYTTRTHDSLVISNGKWNWFSRGVGGKNALDYLIRVKDMSFLDAVRLLANANCEPVLSLPGVFARAQMPAKHILLPHRHINCNKVKGYLELRGIDPFIITECIKSGLIYQSQADHFTNAVFFGKDKGGTPRYAFMRGCTGDFKSEVAGSELLGSSANSPTSTYVRQPSGLPDVSGGRRQTSCRVKAKPLRGCLRKPVTLRSSALCPSGIVAPWRTAWQFFIAPTTHFTPVAFWLQG